MARKITFLTYDGVFGSRACGIMFHRKRVLLCRLVDDDICVLPGGAMNLHETSHEAVKREFMEEAELEIDVQRLLWVIENFFILRRTGARIHDVGFYFLVSANDPEGRWTEDEFNGQEDYWEDWKVVPGKTQPLIFKWFALEELDNLNLKPAVLKELLRELPDGTVHVVHDATR